MADMVEETIITFFGIKLYCVVTVFLIHMGRHFPQKNERRGRVSAKRNPNQQRIVVMLFPHVSYQRLFPS